MVHLNGNFEEKMKKINQIINVISVLLISGCASLDFGDDKGLVYFDAKPYLFVSTTKECVSTATIVTVPAAKREVKFNSGYGSAELSITLNNGMISNVGQKTDTKIPETITAIGTVAKDAALMADLQKPIENKPSICEPTARLYPIDENGFPSRTPIKFEVNLK